MRRVCFMRFLMGFRAQGSPSESWDFENSRDGAGPAVSCSFSAGGWPVHACRAVRPYAQGRADGLHALGE